MDKIKVERHVDRLDRLEQSLDARNAVIDRIIRALENENVSGVRIGHIHDARVSFEFAVKDWPTFKKD